MGNRLSGLLTFAAVLGLAGLEEPGARAAEPFSPHFVSGQIKSKPHETPGYYLITAKFQVAAFAPGYAIDRGTTPVSMEIGFSGQATSSWGWSIEDDGWKVKGTKHDFRQGQIRAKGDLSTGLFSVTIRKLEYHAPGGLASPIRFVILPEPDRALMEGVWTEDPRKPGCFVYEP